MSTPHRWPLRVYYEDTDFSGAVYHASYLLFFERARTEMLRSRGINQKDLFSQTGLGFVVRRLTLDFQRPAEMDDEIIVTTMISAIGGASLMLHQTLHRGTEVLVTAEVMVACVTQGRAARLPAALRHLLTDP